MRRPPRLQRRRHRYYCRTSVPYELRSIIGKAEIIRTLQTADYAEAVERLPLVSAEVNAELAEARRKLGSKPATSLSDHDAKQLVLRWLWVKERALAEAEATADGDGETWLPRDEAISENRLDLSQLLDSDDPGTQASVQKSVGELLDKNNLDIEWDSPIWRKLEGLIRRAMIEQTRRGIDRLQGDFGRTHDPLFRTVYPEEAAPSLPTASEVTLRQLVDRFLDDPTRKAGPKADNDYRVVLRFLGEFVSPDLPLSRVKRDHCRKVVELLTRMPANAGKKRKLRDLRPQEAAVEAKRLGLAPMSSTTANSYITKMSALFKWAVREGLVERNLAEKLSLPEEINKSEARLPFATDQLKAILSTDVFQEPKVKWDHRQWVFLVALFSGLRLNEVCTLRCDDVTKREGADVILVRPDEDGRKRLKSKAARRKVPVHPTLKKLGLLVFVERQQAAGHKVLFPKLKADRRGYYSDGYQKWFTRLLKKAGATAPRTTFHSTRHNFRDQLREIGAPRDVTLALGGWAGNGGTADDYGGGLKPKTLLRWVRKIEYPDLVLPPVKSSST